MRPTTLLASAALSAALAGCAHGPPPGGASGVDARADAARRCELVRTVVREPVPAQLLQEVTPAAGPAPVMVFLRQEGLLERFLDEQSGCADARFTVQRESAAEALVLYLEPTGDGGYAFEARRSSADALVLEGRPTGRVAPSQAGWVSVGDVP
ncbi:MAG TPA: hypothetical protein VFO83_01030 [Aggregicoccus sp.]|nr:hypothetical protein [Aggregicoccus sp.]